MSFIDDFENMIENEIEHIDNLHELGYADDDINERMDLPEDHDWLMTWYDDYSKNGAY